MVVYFDNAATSYPKPAQVNEAMRNFHERAGANPGRSGHRLSVEAGRILYDTRELLSTLFGIDDPLNVVFTLNATMALNIALMGLLSPGDHVITSSMEHNSVARPLRFMEDQGVELTIVPCQGNGGELNPKDVAKAIKPHTKLVALIHASNVTGTIFPIAEVGKITQKKGIPLLVDAAQTAGAYLIDVERMGIDLLAFTGHKSLFGPQGTGGLYVHPDLKLRPLLRGGTGSRSEEDVQPEFMPDRLESGTPNTVGVAGLGAGVKFILSEGLEKIMKHKKRLTQQFLEGLKELKGVTVYGKKDVEDRAAIVSLNIEGRQCSEVGQLLDEKYGVLVRCGLHCAPWAHQTLGTHPQGTVRFSFGYFNTAEDVDLALSALAEIAGSV